MGESKPFGISEIDALRATISVVEQQRENYRQDAKEARAQVSALQAEVERLQKVEGERGRLERDPKGSGYSGSAPSPQAVSASGEYPSRGGTAKAFADAICDGYPAVRDDAFVRVDNPRWAPDNGEDPYIVTKAHDAVRVLANRIDLLKMDHATEMERLTLRLINGPATMQECAEFCRTAREDGDGKPCLDCHPENFTF